MKSLKFNSGLFDTHKKMKDVFIQTIHSEPKNDRYLLYVRWWNKSQGNKPFNMYIDQIIEIKKSNYKDWYYYEWENI